MILIKILLNFDIGVLAWNVFNHYVSSCLFTSQNLLNVDWPSIILANTWVEALWRILLIHIFGNVFIDVISSTRSYCSEKKIFVLLISQIVQNLASTPMGYLFKSWIHRVVSSHLAVKNISHILLIIRVITSRAHAASYCPKYTSTIIICFESAAIKNSSTAICHRRMSVLRVAHSVTVVLSSLEVSLVPLLRHSFTIVQRLILISLRDLV